jgi:hypothetical protein
MNQPVIDNNPRPVIGISCGDLNGIGIELKPYPTSGYWNFVRQLFLHQTR